LTNSSVASLVPQVGRVQQEALAVPTLLQLLLQALAVQELLVVLPALLELLLTPSLP